MSVPQKNQISNYHTDTLIDLLDMQDRFASEMQALAEAFRRRSAMIRQHLADHADMIDFGKVRRG